LAEEPAAEAAPTLGKPVARPKSPICDNAGPNKAIAQGETIYVIDPARCTECVGHYDEPQCVVVCPVECIDPDPGNVEHEPQLLAKLHRLQQELA
jgi:ferredoxin